MLANDILDAAWLPGDVYTLRLIGGETQVQRWSRSNYVQTGTLVVRGRPVRIFRLSDTQLVVVTNVLGTPVFTVIGADLGGVTPGPASVFAGSYFGNVGSAAGNFALHVRRDGTAVLLLFATSPRVGLLASSVSIASDGTFAGTGHDAITRAFSAVAGAIAADGAISGSVAQIALTFSGRKSTGSAASPAVYQAAAINSTAADAYAVTGADGSVFLLALGNGVVEGGAALVGANGRFTAGGGTGTNLSVTLDSATGSLTARGDAGAFAGAAFAGLREDVPRTDRLANISTRGQAGAGDDVMIAGFVLAGNAPRPVLIRAIGPTLGGFGVPGVLMDPRLALYRDGTKLFENDNWSSAPDVVATTAGVGAFPLATGSADAVLLATLDPGAYSAQVSGPVGVAGNALVEVYDAGASSAATAPRLVNIATRGRLASPGDSLTAGLVVTGNAPRRVLIRAVGPGLTSFGVAGALADPILFISSVSGPNGAATIASNDDWTVTVPGAATAADIAAVGSAAGAFPLIGASRDACLLLTLSPGNYTAQVLGKNNSTGIALIEVYQAGN